MLSTPELNLLIITAATFGLLIWNRLPVEMVALLLLLVLGFSELVPAGELFNGFSSPVVMTLLGLFVITRGLEQTGVIQALADRLNRLGRGSEPRLITVFMLAGAGLSLVMNNVAAGAVLLPAVVRVARISNVRVSRLLIPMSFGTLVGGMATYLTTANIVMSTLLIDSGMEGLNMLDFIPTGGLIVAAGVLYMLLIGRHLLPDREPISEAAFLPDLKETYRLEERTWEVRVKPGSVLEGRSLGNSGIGRELGLSVLGIRRGNHTFYAPAPEQTLQVGDDLLVLGRKERLNLLLNWGTRLTNGPAEAHFPQQSATNLTEVIIPPRSAAIGQTLKELDFRQEYGVSVVALWREGRSFRTDVGRMELRVGDALLVTGSPAKIKALARDRSYLVPASGQFADVVRPDNAPLATLITVVVLALAILEVFPIPQVMVAGGVAMVFSGCLTLEEFYQAIEWKVIFLVAGMLPLSIAMIDTGLAERLGTGVVNLLAGAHPVVVIIGMFVFTVLVVQVMGGQVTALLVGPIAISTALQMGVSPHAMSVAVAIGCSTAFLTPIAHPVNILMMGPGGYQFGDFFRVGLGMTLVTLVTLAAGMVLIWGIG
jgi:di/tricarboxylate transporter